MSKRAPVKRESIIEVFMPVGMRLFTALFWIAGLSGMTLGMLVINEGFFESYYDIQLLLIAQGTVLLVFASLMFLVAVGMINGVRWSLDVAKRMSAILVAWSAVGTVLAVYTAFDLTGVEYYVVIFGVVGWLLAFGLVVGLTGLRYLSAAGETVRRYVEYTSTEPLSLQETPRAQRLPLIKRSSLRCIDCGTDLKAETAVCPECGAPQIAQGGA